MSNFAASIVDDPRGGILRVAGRLDYETIGEFEKAAAQLGAVDAKRVVVDVSQLGFLNSAGVGVLLKLHRTTKDRGAEIRLAGATAEVRRMLKLCFLDQVLKVFDDVDAAFAATTT